MEDNEPGPFQFTEGKWRAPSCVHCKHSYGQTCSKAMKPKLSITEIDIYDCPWFSLDERSMMNKAMEAMKVKQM